MVDPVVDLVDDLLVGPAVHQLHLEVGRALDVAHDERVDVHGGRVAPDRHGRPLVERRPGKQLNSHKFHKKS